MQRALFAYAPVRQWDREMVLQVGTNAREVLERCNPQLTQSVRVADTGEHQQLGRVERAACNDHFPPGTHPPERASPQVLHPYGSLVLEHDFGGK